MFFILLKMDLPFRATNIAHCTMNGARYGPY